MAINYLIKKGDTYKCIKTVNMSSDGRIEYVAGKIYTSEQDGCLTDESGIKEHYWLEDDLFEKYFIPYNENTNNEVVTYALCHRSVYATFANFSEALSNSSHVYHELAKQYRDDIIGYYSHLGTTSPVFSVVKVYTRQRIVEVLTDNGFTDKGELVYTVKEKIKLKQNGG